MVIYVYMNTKFDMCFLGALCQKHMLRIFVNKRCDNRMFSLRNLGRHFSKLQFSVMPYYAVRVGRQTGIYNTWEDCKKQVNGVPARFKKFSTLEEAQNFMAIVDPRDAKLTPFNAERNQHGKKRKNEDEIEGNEKRLKEELDNDPERVVVYSDGCCLSNGRYGAKAGIGVYWADGDPRNVSEKLQGDPQTNQRAELNAAIKALEIAIKTKNINKIEIRTDSMYTLNAVTRWMDSWRKNGFRTANGNDVKNKDDIVKLYKLCQKIDVKWTHVRGHQGHEGNEKADELAKKGALP